MLSHTNILEINRIRLPNASAHSAFGVIFAVILSRRFIFICLKLSYPEKYNFTSPKFFARVLECRDLGNFKISIQKNFL